MEVNTNSLSDSVRALEDECERLRAAANEREECWQYLAQHYSAKPSGLSLLDLARSAIATVECYEEQERKAKADADTARAELEQCKRDLDGWRTDALREAGLAKRYYEEAERLRGELEQARRELAALASAVRDVWGWLCAHYPVPVTIERISGVVTRALDRYASGPAGSAHSRSEQSCGVRTSAQPAGSAASRDYLAAAEQAFSSQLGHVRDNETLTESLGHVIAHLRQQQGKGAAPEEERVGPDKESPLPWHVDLLAPNIYDANDGFVAQCDEMDDARFIVACVNAANRANGGG